MGRAEEIYQRLKSQQASVTPKSSDLLTDSGAAARAAAVLPTPSAAKITTGYVNPLEINEDEIEYAPKEVTDLPIVLNRMVAQGRERDAAALQANARVMLRDVQDQSREAYYKALMQQDENAPRLAAEGKMLQEQYETALLDRHYHLHGAPLEFAEAPKTGIAIAGDLERRKFTYDSAEEAQAVVDIIEGTKGEPVGKLYKRDEFATDEENDIYYYLLKTRGAETAAEYDRLIRERLESRQGVAEAEEILAEERDVVRGLKGTGYAAQSGLTNFGRNVSAHLTGERAPSHYDAGMQTLVDGSSKLAGYWYKGVQSTATQLPGIVAAAVSGDPALAYMSTFTSASGGAYADARAKGMTNGQARLYGGLVGAAEVALDKLLGGVGKQMGLTDEILMSRASKLQSGLLRIPAKLGIRIGNEVTEEELMLWLEPAMESLIGGFDFEAPDWEEMLETAIVTAISTPMMEGGQMARDIITPATIEESGNADGGDEASSAPQDVMTAEAQRLFGQQGGTEITSEDGKTAVSEETTEKESGENKPISAEDLEEYLSVGDREHVRNQKVAQIQAGDSPLLTSVHAIRNFLENSFLGNIRNTIKCYGKVGSKMASDILQKSGGSVDTDGYYLELDSNRLEHLTEHVEGDGDPRNIPLTEEQALNLTDYINTYDDVLDVVKRKDGSVRIHLGKRINGHAVIVELVSKGRKSVQPVTAWQNTTEHYMKKYHGKATGTATTSHSQSTDELRGYKAVPVSEASATSQTGLTAEPSINSSIPASPEKCNPQDSGNTVGAAEAGFDPFTHAMMEHGTQYGGMNAVRDDAMPTSMDGESRVSGTAVSAKGAAVTPDSFVPLLERAVTEGKNGLTYMPITNSETVQQAMEIILEENWAGALKVWHEAVGRGRADAKTIALGALLYNNAVNSGDTEQAMDILSDYAAIGRQAAQALQAMQILKRMSPDNRLYMITKSIDKLNRQYFGKKTKKQNAADGRKAITLRQDLKDAYLAAKTDAERDSVIAKMQQDVAEQLPSTLMDQWNALRYTNMLGNFKTMERNILGNITMRGTAEVKNAVKTLFEAITGGKFGKTGSLFVSKSLMDAAGQDFEAHKDVIKGENRYSDNLSSDAFIRGAEEQKKIFTSKNKVIDAALRPMEGYRTLTDKAMNNKYFGDEAFVRSAYKRFLGGYLQANGITAEQFLDPEWQKKNATFVEKARDYAARQAQETTFRDTNAFSDAISKFGRRNDKKSWARFITEGIMPFRKTPANVLVRAEQYSLLGLINTVANAIKAGNGSVSKTTGEVVTGQDVLESLAKTCTGSGLFALGMLLRSMGILRGSKDEDEKQAAFDDLTGEQEYSLVFGDGTSITLDWLSPVSMPLFMGAKLEELRQEDGLSWADLWDSLKSVSDPMLEMSMMSGVNDALETVNYSDSPLIDFALNASLGYLSQGLTNTLLGQVSRSFRDESLMTYVDRDSPVPDFLQKAAGAASRKYPGGGINQVPYIDAWGRTENDGDTFAGRLANNVFNPSFVSNESKDAVETELQRVYDNLPDDDDSTVFPTRAEKSFEVNGKRKYLTANEYVTYAKRKGQESYSLVQAAIRCEAYGKMSDAEKAKFLDKMYGLANYRAKKAVAPDYESAEFAKYEEAIKFGMTPAVYYSLRHEGDTDGSGGLSQDEARAYLDEKTDLTHEQKRGMWPVIDSGWKTNPYAGPPVSSFFPQFKAPTFEAPKFEFNLSLGGKK